MKNVSSTVRRFTASAVLSAAMVAGGGFSAPAHALDVNFGDLVLAMFGNATEYFKVLGPASSIINQQDQQFDVSSALPAVQGANNVRWTLFSNDDQGGMVTASSKPLNDWTPNEQSSTNSVFAINSGLFWTGMAPATLPAGTETTVVSTDPMSFTSTFFTDGTMAGSFPVGQEGQLESLLHLIGSDFNSPTSFNSIGTAMLTANGLLTINPSSVAPIPLPAAAWLFGTGLIGLAGLARRSSRAKI